MAQGDFGRAITTNRPLRTTIADRFPATLELTLAAMVVAIGVGVFVGALAARFRDTFLDVGGRLLGILLYAAPIFWLGIMLQLLFSIQLHWLPTGGRIAPFHEPRSITRLYLVDALVTADWAALGSAFRYLILPAATLGMVIGGIFIRLVRVNMLQTLKSDYVEAARARGIGERRVLFNHAFRNALVPVVTIVGLQFALLLGGAVLTEATFTWPGHRPVALPVPPEPGLHRGPGAGDVLRPVRGGREPAHRRRLGVGRSPDPVPVNARLGPAAEAVADDAPHRPPADGGGGRDHRAVPGHGRLRPVGGPLRRGPVPGAAATGPAQRRPLVRHHQPPLRRVLPGRLRQPGWRSRW